MTRYSSFRRAVSKHRTGLSICAAFTIPAGIAVLQLCVRSRLDRHVVKWQDLLFAGGEWLLVGLFAPVTYQLGKRFPFSRIRVKRWIAIHALGAMAVSAAYTSFFFALGILLHTVSRKSPLLRTYVGWSLDGFPFWVAIYFAGCTYAYSHLIEAKRRETQAARLEAQLSEARLSALRMQLNPHFLFNSLNALAVLVREPDTPAASRMLELIADVLRQVLRPNQPNEIPLAEEVEFLSQYLAIEQVRFSDRLDVRWNLQPGTLQALVPSFIMQPIVENAIKHGLLKNADAGLIEISARITNGSVELRVGNDGDSLPKSSARVGVGLANTKERLQTLYGDRAKLSLTSQPAGGTEATIVMPLRTVSQ